MSSTDRIYIHEKDASFVQIDADSGGTLMELGDYFSFEVPGARFMPSFKYGSWDGRIRLLDRNTHCLYKGLIPHVKKFAADRDYEVVDETVSVPLGTKEDAEEYLSKLPLTASDGSVLTPYDWQREALGEFAKRNGRFLILSPTGSGKSLVIYTTFRYLETKRSSADEGKRILLVVPNLFLIEQMKSDFGEYSANDSSFDPNKHVQLIHGGQPTKIEPNTRIVISTWQSIYKLPKQWFTQFFGILCDEVHLFKSTCLKTILEKATTCNYRVGTTGTLDGMEMNKLILMGLFGPVYVATTARKEIASGRMSKLNIEAIMLRYEPVACKQVRKLKDYLNEVDFVVSHEKRRRFVCKLALSCKGNTLVLFKLKKNHGRPLFEMLSNMCRKTNRRCYYIAGEVEAEDREAIRRLIEVETDAIILATYGTCSTGVNIKRLHNIILAAPSKSQVQVLQSVGRGTRLAKDKCGCTIYDIVDDFSEGRAKVNYLMKHFHSRLAYYQSEGHPYKICPVQEFGKSSKPEAPHK